MPGIGISLSLQARRHAAALAVPFELPLSLTTVLGTEAPMIFGFGPEQRTTSAGVVTALANLTGGSFTLTGSPANYEDGPVGAIELDGVNDRIDLTFSGVDDSYISIWMLCQPISYPPFGGYEGWLELSDSAASDRSHWLYAYGSSDSIGLRTGDSNGAISYPTTGNLDNTAVMLIRLDVASLGGVQLARSLWIDGIYRGSSAYPGKTTRTVDRVRLGNRVAGDVGYGNLRIFALAAYSGGFAQIDDASKLTVDNGLMGWGGITKPFDYLNIPSATVTTGDPRLIMPDHEDVLLGVPLAFERDSLGYRNGRIPDANRTIEHDFALVAATPTGRVTVVPDQAGVDGQILTVTEGAYSTTTIFSVYDVPAGAPKKWCVYWGNSNANRARKHVLAMLRTLFGDSQLGWLGLVAPDAAYPPSEGHDSWVLSALADALGGSGAFDAVGSPFYNGGASLDMAGYFASLAHAPTHMIAGGNLQNAIVLAYNSGYSDTQLEDVLAAERTAALNIHTAANVAVPGIALGWLDEWPLPADPAIWGSWAARDKVHRFMHRGAEVARDIIADAVGAGCDCSLIPTFHHVGIGSRPSPPWEDNYHLSPWGGLDILSPVGGWLATH